MELTAGVTLHHFHTDLQCAFTSFTLKSVALIVILDTLFALTYFNLQTGWDHIFQSTYASLSARAVFDLPPGIIRDRAPVDTDFGTFATAPMVFSAALSGRREVV